MAEFIHSIVQTPHIGPNVQIGEFSVVREDVRLGNGVILHPQVMVYGGVEIGDGVEIFPGAVIGRPKSNAGAFAGTSPSANPLSIGAGSVVGARAVLCGGSQLSPGVSVGDGATIQWGISIGENASVEPNVFLNRDVPAGGLVKALPARMAMPSSGVFVHENGLVESQQVGEGTRVWAHTHILPGAQIGRDCNICDQTFIENDVVIGDRVTVKCGVHIWDGARIGNDVFIGPGVAFTNDRFPRSKQYPEAFSPIEIREGASIGANATLLPGIIIGENAMIGAGAVVVKDVPPETLVVGNPARIVRRFSPGSGA